MINEMRDWQSDEIKELQERVLELESQLTTVESAHTKALAQNTELRKEIRRLALLQEHE